MAMRLSLPAALSWQPQTTPVIARNRLTEGLIDAIIPVAGGAFMAAVNTADTGKNSASPQRQDLNLFTNTNGGTVPDFTQYGVARRYVRVSTQYSSRNSAPLQQLAECAALVLVRSPGTEGSGNPYFAYGKSGGGVSDRNLFMLGNQGPGNVQFRVRDANNTDQTFNATGGLGIGNFCIIGTRSQAQNFVRCYSNGRLIGSTTATTMVATTFDRTGVCILLRNTAALAQDGSISLCLAWDRALQPDEAVALSVNPWQVFDYPSQPIFLDTVAAAAAGFIGQRRVSRFMPHILR